MDEIRKQLKAHGTRRDRARAQAMAESEAIRELLPAALKAGMTKVEIARLTGLSRPALDTMLRDH